MEEQRVKVRIRSEITAYNIESGFASAQAAEEDTIEYVVEGSLESRGDLITVRYREMEQMGMGDVETSVVLRESQKSRVTILRKGQRAGSMVFDAEKERTFCRYDTGVMPIELCLYTRKIENRINRETGGKLKLDYDVELQGAKSQRTRFFMEVERVKEWP